MLILAAHDIHMQEQFTQAWTSPQWPGCKLQPDRKYRSVCIYRPMYRRVTLFVKTVLHIVEHSLGNKSTAGMTSTGFISSLNILIATWSQSFENYYYDNIFAINDGHFIIAVAWEKHKIIFIPFIYFSLIYVNCFDKGFF